MFSNSKQSYKPGSVPSFPKVVIICLGSRLPGISSNLPGGETGRFYASLFGLAPGGVYLAAQSPERRCALTAPLHPYPALLGGFHFCGTIPWGYPLWVLPSTLPCGARTFLTYRLSTHGTRDHPDCLPSFIQFFDGLTIITPSHCRCKFAQVDVLPGDKHLGNNGISFV